MYITFAEYRIISEFKEDYLASLSALRADEKRLVQLYEACDQPCLFVEVWYANSEDEAERIKEERLDGCSSWSGLSQWIAGGPAKLHVWSFKPVISVAGKEHY